MSFFQMPFGEEFRGEWVLGDRQFSLTFPISANPNNIGQFMFSGNVEPFDFSVFPLFTINFAFDPERKNYTAVTVDVSGTIPASTSAAEVAGKLNADPLFADNFVATTEALSKGSTLHAVVIQIKRPKYLVRVFVSNSGAESVLRFNSKAHVAELPTYFERHTVDNRFNPLFPNSTADLILLDPGDPIDAAIIVAAGLDPLDPKEDWELLRGRSGLFEFRKFTHDGAGRVTEMIEYSAGAIPGNLAKRIQYTYTGASLSPDQITEEPHTLETGDLVIPPP